MTGHPSIWLRPDRAARGPVPEHSRAEIAAASVALADATGLGAVTMRSVAAAIGAAPASLYRYVTTRGQVVELMADHVYGELPYGRPPSGDAAADLFGLAQEALVVYRRHPWLLDLPAPGGLPGPNALAYTEQVLSALRQVALTGAEKLETVGLFSGAVRMFAEAERERLRAGQDASQWQDSLASYLVTIAAGGQHPYLTAALSDQGADQGADQGTGQDEPLFDRALRRILAGLLPGQSGKSEPV
jgi:AcrR family transcriptional regulator